MIYKSKVFICSLLCLFQWKEIKARTSSPEDYLSLDLLKNPSKNEARFFDYTRSSYNTSIAFTIPVFHLTIPHGSTLGSHPGSDVNSFGVITFSAMFLMTALGVALTTTTGGGKKENLFGFRSLLNDNCDQYDIFDKASNLLSDLPNVFDVENCARLSVCSALAEPERYGLLSWPFRVLFSSRNESESKILTPYETAASYGLKTSIDKCYYEYPCIVGPLDTAIYLKDWILSTD